MRSPRTRTRSPPSVRFSRDRSVFINCPFDAAYQPLLRAVCFALLACGYGPRCALDFSDSGAIRLQQIVRLISESGLSIHDISRADIDASSGLPRFNMALELGIDLGLRLGGSATQRDRRTLVLDAEKHRYDKMLSDISGMDIEAHFTDSKTIIKCVRDWLNASRGDRPVLPGAASIAADYKAFEAIAPSIIERLRLDASDALPHRDFLYVVEQALPQIERARSVG